MVAYFCHPDDNDMLLSNKQRAYHCLPGWYFFAFDFLDFFWLLFFCFDVQVIISWNSFCAVEAVKWKLFSFTAADIYARGSRPFLLETSRQNVSTGDRSKLLCTLLPPQREKFKGMRSLFCCWYPCYEKFEGMRGLFCCWYPRYEKFEGMRSLFCCWYPRYEKFMGMRNLFCCWYPRYEKFKGMRSLFCCWYPRYGKFEGMRSLFYCWYPNCENRKV